MRKNLYKLFVVILLVLSSALLQAAPPLKTLTLGIFAYRPKAIMLEQYQPLVDYLNTQFCQCQIKLQILELDEIEAALAANQLDFIFTNPRHYIVLRHQKKLTGAIATLIKHSASGASTQSLGGVIFTRSTADDINQLADIKGRRIAIPGTKYLGGYQAQAYELLQAGITLPDDAKLIEVGRHDNVINTVLSGKADIGFVRTEILENMSHNGKFTMAQIKILNRQNNDHFPFITSTRLYPEWPFIALPHVELKIVSQVASSLLAINDQQIEIHKAGIAGFAPPADYLPVEKVARALRLPPYENVSNFTLQDIWKKHKDGLVLLALFIIIILLLIMLLLRRNKIVVEQQATIEEHARRIEHIVDATRVGTWEWDIQTGKTIFNERWANILGYRLDELLPISIQTWMDLTHPYDLKIAQEILQEYFEHKTDFYETDFRMKHKLGHWVWINDRGQVTKWAADGSPQRMSGTHTDISERKDFEQQISQAHRLIEQSLNEIYLFDKTTLHFVEVNSGARKNLGYSMQELAKLTPLDIKPEMTAEEFSKIIQPLIIGAEEKRIFETVHQRKDGSHYPVEVHLQLLDEEQPVFIAIILDITERLQRDFQLQQSEQKYRHLVENISNEYFFYVHDLNGVFTFISPSITSMLGYTPEEFCAHYDSYLTENPVNEKVRNKTALTLRGIKQPPYLLEIYNKSRKKYWLEVNESASYDNQGKIIAVEGIAKDITQQRLAQEQQRLAATVFANSQEGILITDKDNHIIDVNPACVELTGYTREEVIGNTPNMFGSGTHPQEFYDEMWKVLNRSGHWQGEIWNRKKSGEIYSERLSINIVPDENGKIQHYVAVFYDITYLKEHEAALKHIAYNDALTGLPNRLLLQDRMQQAISKTKRSKKLLAVCYLDLDGFKPINDSYGHKAGDKVLVEVAKRLQNVVRADDTVSRIGGDEFVLLMLDIESIVELKQVLERILVNISNTYVVEMEEIDYISASIGLTLFPHDKSDADMLLRHADQAMYIAKQRGKNRYSFFDLNDELRVTAEHSMQQSIKLALERNEFRLFYQPKAHGGGYWRRSFNSLVASRKRFACSWYFFT